MKRIDFSIGAFQAVFIGAAGIAVLFGSFVLGILVGKEMEGVPILDNEVKSQVVRMRIEPVRPLSRVDAVGEGPKVMDNATSKPRITFYDTLMAKREVPPKRLYTIQVGAMKDRESAEKMASRLKRNGYSAYVVVANTSGRETLFKVRLGSFSSREGAMEEASKIRNDEGLQTMVVEK